jgi:hypothetical protein
VVSSGGGADEEEALELKEESRFCADDLRRIVGLFDAIKQGRRARQFKANTLSDLQPPRTMADINTIAKQFSEFYYSTFDSNRASLAALYVRRFFLCTKSMALKKTL